MGYEYIHINSAHRKDYETTSQMTIHLSNPIQRAHSVKVMSFSCANEFYNIGNGYVVSIVAYRFGAMGVIVGDDPIRIEVGLDPGLYTVEEMCEFLNEELTPAVRAVLPNCTMQFIVMAGSKVSLQIVQIKAEGTENIEPLRVVLFYPTDIGNFYTSIIHRLGFSRTQVASQMPLFRTNEEGYVEASVPNEGWVPEDVAPYLVWQPHDTEGLGTQAKLSANIGFESSPFLYLKSDELVKRCTRTVKNTDGSTCTAHTNILQSIPIAVNIFNWIHYFGNDAIFTHTLDGRTIQDFDIGLTDHYDSKADQLSRL